MFSLIITIVAIALVAAIAIATIYYGGTVAQLAFASANAATLANQGAQIYAASLLYEQNMGSWPASTDDLVTGHYLTAVPIPPSSSYALNDSALVTDALADNAAPAATDWTWVTNGSRNIWVQDKINAPTCHAVNQKFGTGFDIATGVKTDVAIQCFGSGPAYTFVFIAPVGANGRTICADMSASADSAVRATPCGTGGTWVATSWTVGIVGSTCTNTSAPAGTVCTGGVWVASDLPQGTLGGVCAGFSAPAGTICLGTPSAPSGGGGGDTSTCEQRGDCPAPATTLAFSGQVDEFCFLPPGYDDWGYPTTPWSFDVAGCTLVALDNQSWAGWFTGPYTTVVCGVDATPDQTISGVQFQKADHSWSDPVAQTAIPGAPSYCTAVVIPTLPSLGYTAGVTSYGTVTTNTPVAVTALVGGTAASGSVTYIADLQISNTLADVNYSCMLDTGAPAGSGSSSLTGPLVGGDSLTVAGLYTDGPNLTSTPTAYPTVMAGATVTFAMQSLVPFEAQVNSWVMGWISEDATMVGTTPTNGPLTFKAPPALPALVTDLASSATAAPYATLPNFVDNGDGTFSQVAQVYCTNPGGMGGFWNYSYELPLQYYYPMPVIASLGPNPNTAVVTLIGSGFSPGLDSVFFGNKVATITSESATSITVATPTGANAPVPGTDIIRVRVSGRVDSNGVVTPALGAPAMVGTFTASPSCWAQHGCDPAATMTFTENDSVDISGAVTVSFGSKGWDVAVVDGSTATTLPPATSGHGTADLALTMKDGNGTTISTGVLHFNPEPLIDLASVHWEQLDQDEYRLTLSGTNLTGAKLAVASIPNDSAPPPGMPTLWVGDTGGSGPFDQLQYEDTWIEAVGPSVHIRAISEESGTATSYSALFNLRLVSPPAEVFGSIRAMSGGGIAYGQTFGMLMQAPDADGLGGYSNGFDLVDTYIVPPPVPDSISYDPPINLPDVPAAGGGTQIFIGFGADTAPLSGALPIGAIAPASCEGVGDTVAQNACVAGVASALLGGSCSTHLEYGANLGYSTTRIETMYCNNVSQAAWTAARGTLQSWYLTLYHTSSYP